MKLGVRMDGAGLGQYLTALDLVALHAAQQRADVVAGFRVIQRLAEHLDTGDNRLSGGSSIRPTISTYRGRSA